MAGERFEGVRVPDPGFAGDTGAVPADVGAALASYADDPGTYAAALATLRTARLLVPVVALLGEVAIDEAGLAHDKSSDMAAVLLTGADGRTALLGVHRARSRCAAGATTPGRSRCPRQVAARAALQDGAAALVVDVAGPVPFVVQGDDLVGLAAGWRIARVGDTTGWVRPAPLTLRLRLVADRNVPVGFLVDRCVRSRPSAGVIRQIFKRGLVHHRLPPASTATQVVGSGPHVSRRARVGRVVLASACTRGGHLCISGPK